MDGFVRRVLMVAAASPYVAWMGVTAGQAQLTAQVGCCGGLRVAAAGGAPAGDRRTVPGNDADRDQPLEALPPDRA